MASVHVFQKHNAKGIHPRFSLTDSLAPCICVLLSRTQYTTNQLRTYALLHLYKTTAQVSLGKYWCPFSKTVWRTAQFILTTLKFSEYANYQYSATPKWILNSDFVAFLRVFRNNNGSLHVLFIRDCTGAELNHSLLPSETAFSRTAL